MSVFSSGSILTRGQQEKDFEFDAFTSGQFTPLTAHVSGRFALPAEFTVQTSDAGARRILCQFLFMCVAFSLTHGSVGAAVSLAPAFLGEETGSYTSGTIYGCWFLSAFFAPLYTPLFRSPTTMMVWGMWAYACYMALNWLAVSDALAFRDGADGAPAACSALVEDEGVAACPAQFTAAMTGSVLAGLGAGPLYVGECLFFAASARTYAGARGDVGGAGSARSFMSGTFASVYVGTEMLLKLSASWIKDVPTTYIVFMSCTLVAVIAATLFLKDPGESGGASSDYDALESFVQQEEKAPTAVEEILAVPRVVFSSATGFCALVFYNVLFGFACGMEGSIIVGRLIAGGILGGSNAGYAVAILTGTATVTSVLLSLLGGVGGRKRGRSFPARALVAVLAGPVCYVVVAAVLLGVGETEIQNGGWGYIVVLEVLMGLGRAAWEAVNLACVAEWFAPTKEDPQRLRAAFAARIMFNAVAGMVAFFVLPHASTEGASIAFAAIAGVAGSLYLVAGFIQSAEAVRGAAERARFPPKQSSGTAQEPLIKEAC